MEIKKTIHDMARLCRFFGWTWHYVAQDLPYGVYLELLTEIERIKAGELADLFLLSNSKDPKWLYDRWRALEEHGPEGKKYTDEETLKEWEALKEAFGK